MLKRIALAISLVVAVTTAHAWGDREQGALAGAVLGYVIGQHQQQQQAQVQPQYNPQYQSQQPQYGNPYGNQQYRAPAPRAIYQPTCPRGYIISYERVLSGPDVGGRYTDAFVPVCR
jgi:hypothetical protein